MSKRITSLEEFWPHYLSEHAEPTSRMLHFLGTTGFFAAALSSLYFSTVPTIAALFIVTLCAGFAAKYVEPRRAAFLPATAMIAALVAANPTIMPFGILFAYLCAWVGHFNFEGNRPATFRYPVWSLLCDLRMWARMATGQLWWEDAARV